MFTQINLLYLLLIIPSILTWLAQSRVRKTYEQYRQVSSKDGYAGAEVARQLLSLHGLADVRVERAPAKLSDHYDPQKKALRLSDETAESVSLTSLGIVAHEVGHAVQDAEGYSFQRLRNRLAQPLTVMAQMSPWFYIGGFWFGMTLFMFLAVLMLAVMAVFSLITLPVERDASKRAENMLQEAGLVRESEIRSVRRVLRTAAYTYLANLGRRVASFLFFVGVIGAGRGLIA